MKPAPVVLAALIGGLSAARSQDKPVAISRESAVAPVTAPTAARILSDIPDGTPPPPQAPKPEYKVAKSDILQTTTHEQGGRTITLQQIKPIALPPPLPAEASVKVSEEFSQRLAEYREAHPRFDMLFIGATVYRSNDQPPRTLIHVWPTGGSKAIELWSNVDMALIAGGINTFSDAAGNTHELFISWSNVEIDRLSDLFASKGKEYPPPVMPAFPGGKATFQIIGNPPAAEDLIAIQTLHDLYNNNYQRLKDAYEGREQARITTEAQMKAHPPKPKDLIINHWRIEAPQPSVQETPTEGAAK